MKDEQRIIIRVNSVSVKESGYIRKRNKKVGWILFITGWITLIVGFVWVFLAMTVPLEEMWWKVLVYLVWIVSVIVSVFLIATGARLADINWTIKGYVPQEYGS